MLIPISADSFLILLRTDFFMLTRNLVRLSSFTAFFSFGSTNSLSLLSGFAVFTFGAVVGVSTTFLLLFFSLSALFLSVIFSATISIFSFSAGLFFSVSILFSLWLVSPVVSTYSNEISQKKGHFCRRLTWYFITIL